MALGCGSLCAAHLDLFLRCLTHSLPPCFAPPTTLPLCPQVNLPEEAFLRSRVMDAILGPDPFRNRVWLPGSQPVSLDASNKSLLEERPYWCGGLVWVVWAARKRAPRLPGMQPSAQTCSSRVLLPGAPCCAPG